MATYYFDGDLWAGSKAGAGTEASPYNSLLPIIDADITLANGDTLYLTGTFRPNQGSYLALSGVNNLTVAHWPGQSRPQMRGDTIPATSDWTQGVNVGTDDNTYLYTVAEEPYAVAWNYDSNIGTLEARETAIGCEAFHFGFLSNAASLAACQSTAGTWFWNGTTTLYVNPPAGATAPDTGDSYSVCWKTYASVGDGINANGCDDILVNGIDFWLYCGWAANNGYAVQMLSCARGKVVDCTAHEWGWHAFGGVGTGHDGSRIINCTVYGGYQADVNGDTYNGGVVNPFVFAHTTTSSGNASDFEFSGCKWYLHRARNTSEEPLDGISDPPNAFLCHGATGSTISDVRVRDCTVYAYNRSTQANIGAFADANNSALGTSTAGDPANYEMRVFDSAAYHAGLEACGFAGDASYERCLMDCNTTSGPPTPSGGVTGWMRYNATGYTHLQFCTIIYRADNVGSGCLVSLTGAATAPHVYFRYCTIHNTGTTHSNRRGTIIYEQGSAAFQFTFERCVFSATSTTGSLTSGTFTQYFFEAGSNADFLKFIFDNCAWYGYSATLGMAWDGADVTAATMESTYDTAGEFRGQINPGYVSVASNDVSAPPASDLRSLVLVDSDFAGERGINDKPYSGNYGSVQYGAGARSRNFRARAGGYVR